MFFLFGQICGAHPDIQCSSQSNGNIGQLSYYHNNEFQKKVTEYHHSAGDREDVKNWNHIAGSICPHQSGMTNIKAVAWSVLQAKFVNDEIQQNGVFGWQCTGTNTQEWNVYLYANRCYPLSIGDYTTCLSGNWLDGYINGTKINSESATIMDCYTTDCLPGYYTDTCEKKVDAYCNEHGYPEYGRTSDAIGCVCDSFKDNIFCEDTTQYVFESGKRGVQMKTYYDSSKIETTEIFENFSYHEIGESYSTVEISSVLYVPQNTDLQFQLTSVPAGELYIDGVLVNGTLSDRFSCENNEFKTIETPRKYFKRGNHVITIKMNAGCAIYTQAFELKWKFYRWHRNNPPEQYEPIPSRYLGLP